MMFHPPQHHRLELGHLAAGLSKSFFALQHYLGLELAWLHAHAVLEQSGWLVWPSRQRLDDYVAQPRWPQPLRSIAPRHDQTACL